MTVIAGARERSAVSSAAFTIGAQAGDVINVGIQLKGEGAAGAQGADVNQSLAVLAYLSDNDDGSSIAGTAPSGGIAVGTDGLAVEAIADKLFLLVSEADGDIDLDITEAGADTWHLVLILPNGELAVSGAITFA
jgi:hypothetical protein